MEGEGKIALVQGVQLRTVTSPAKRGGGGVRNLIEERLLHLQIRKSRVRRWNHALASPRNLIMSSPFSLAPFNFDVSLVSSQSFD
jgi:hypothetical protein